MSETDHANITWTKATSKNGMEYETGQQVTTAAEDGVTAAPVTAKAFSVRVRWEPTKDPVWKDTPSDVRDITSIRRYNFCETGDIWPLPKYILEFQCGERNIYGFTDETIDTYTKTVINTESTHAVRFSSDKPTIIVVSGL
jgi:hypothetical protein